MWHRYPNYTPTHRSPTFRVSPGDRVSPRTLYPWNQHRGNGDRHLPELVHVELCLGTGARKDEVRVSESSPLRGDTPPVVEGVQGVVVVYEGLLHLVAVALGVEVEGAAEVPPAEGGDLDLEAVVVGREDGVAGARPTPGPDPAPPPTPHPTHTPHHPTPRHTHHTRHVIHLPGPIHHTRTPRHIFITHLPDPTPHTHIRITHTPHTSRNIPPTYTHTTHTSHTSPTPTHTHHTTHLPKHIYTHNTPP